MRAAAPFAALALLLACAPSDGGAPSVELDLVVLPTEPDTRPDTVSIELRQPGQPPLHVPLVLEEGQWRGRATVTAGENVDATVVGLDAGGATIAMATAAGAPPIDDKGSGLLVVGMGKGEGPPPSPPSNKAPAIVWLAASATQVVPGGSVLVDGFALDPNLADNFSLKYAWTATAGSFDKASSPLTFWRAPGFDTDARLTLTVTDRWGAKTSASFTILVRARRGSARVNVAVNGWPAVTVLESPSASADFGQPVTLRAAGFDPEGDPLSWSWRAACPGTFQSSTGAQAVFVPAPPYPPGYACPVTVHVQDGRGGSNDGTLVLRVAPPPAPQAAHDPPGPG